MLRFNDIADRLLEYNPQVDLARLQRAYVFTAKVHDGQERLSGEPYLIHPLEVAGILLELFVDEDTIIAGLLHDTLEDTLTTREEIERLFGPKVAFLVEGLTKIARIEFRSAREQQAENFRKMLIAMSEDIRILMIKLSDRLHNMRTLEHMNEDARRRVAQETIDIYVPLAHRLGVYWMKQELEDLAFRTLEPEVAAELEAKLLVSHDEREHYMEGVIGAISTRLAEVGLPCEVKGRVKDISSIHAKMKSHDIEIEQIYDAIGFRVVIDGNIGDCYGAVGQIHAIWPPVPGRFKDYIALPKPNGYRSLHTTVIGQFGERMEIQIRTQVDAPRRRARHRRALEIQGRPRRRRARRHQIRLAPAARRMAEGDLGSPRIPRCGEAQPLPRRGLRLHAEGRGHQPARRLDADRFRLRDPQRDRLALFRRQGERPPRAAAPEAEGRGHGRDPDPARAGAAQGLARVRGLVEGAQPHPVRDPPGGQGARRGARTRSPAARAAQGRPLPRAGRGGRPPRPLSRERVRRARASTICSRRSATASSRRPGSCAS